MPSLVFALTRIIPKHRDAWGGGWWLCVRLLCDGVRGAGGEKSYQEKMLSKVLKGTSKSSS